MPRSRTFAHAVFVCRVVVAVFAVASSPLVASAQGFDPPGGDGLSGDSLTAEIEDADQIDPTSRTPRQARDGHSKLTPDLVLTKPLSPASVEME